jgi:hypothetical protein
LKDLPVSNVLVHLGNNVKYIEKDFLLFNHLFWSKIQNSKTLPNPNPRHPFTKGETNKKHKKYPSIFIHIPQFSSNKKHLEQSRPIFFIKIMKTDFPNK